MHLVAPVPRWDLGPVDVLVAVPTRPLQRPAHARARYLLHLSPPFWMGVDGWYRSNTLTGAMRTIPLTKGKVAIVDDEDYEWLSEFKWHYRESWSSAYAARTLYLGGGRSNPKRYKTLPMHHAIMPPPKGYIIDHANRNSLDNRRANLRIATRSQNSMNRYQKLGSSKYKGVIWRKERNKWVAKIYANRKPRVLGTFDSEIAAAQRYDEEARKVYGEYAALNFPSSSPGN